jgi:hypothetical protein
VEVSEPRTEVGKALSALLNDHDAKCSLGGLYWAPDDIPDIEAEAAALERERLRRAARLLEEWDQSAVLDLLADPEP